MPLPQVNQQQPSVDEVAWILRQPCPLHFASGCGATVECKDGICIFTDVDDPDVYVWEGAGVTPWVAPLCEAKAWDLGESYMDLLYSVAQAVRELGLSASSLLQSS